MYSKYLCDVYFADMAMKPDWCCVSTSYVHDVTNDVNYMAYVFGSEGSTFIIDNLTAMQYSGYQNKHNSMTAYVFL